ncbi:MAG: SsrA-binding protein SmpB [Spirochaetia bacterium]|nr:SsrA-binding protein SmpB [Spirochaetia bacterium]
MKDSIKTLQKNKKAFYNFEIIDSLECGIELKGSEVKSIRLNKFSFSDSYIRLTKHMQLVLVGFHISKYEQATIENHDPDRERKLLAHAQEIKRLKRKVDEKGLTLVPIKVYLKGNLVKIEIALAKGKKMHDKRNSIRERDMKRDAERSMKYT